MRSSPRNVSQRNNYFVIVSRDALSQLPYSVDEIYGLRNVSDTQKYKTYKRIYNEMYKLYHLDPQGTKDRCCFCKKRIREGEAVSGGLSSLERDICDAFRCSGVVI